ncbi:hypothetical protein ACJX0J_019452 [Zea mays]
MRHIALHKSIDTLLNFNLTGPIISVYIEPFKILVKEDILLDKCLIVLEEWNHHFKDECFFLIFLEFICALHYMIAPVKDFSSFLIFNNIMMTSGEVVLVNIDEVKVFVLVYLYVHGNFGRLYFYLDNNDDKYKHYSQQSLLSMFVLS